MLQAQDAKGLQGLAAHLAQQRQALLDRIRQAVTQDPAISAARSLARQSFFDSLPEILGALEQRLWKAGGAAPAAAPDEPERAPARRHGRHRFEQGYSLAESIREWRHVSACLIDAAGSYASDQHLSPRAMSTALYELSELVNDGLFESAQRHQLLQQRAASRRSEELQEALQQVRVLERQRAKTWRQAVHDLRGSVGAIANASALLKRQGTPGRIRELSSEALTRGLSSVREMLNDLSSLARLEAGQERLRLSVFDAAEVLGELASTARPLALMRGLRLETAGPERLEVEGDPIKVHRIAQNLLLNALRYTEQGGVCLSWEAEPGDPQRWRLSVRDSGPGLDPGLDPGSPQPGAEDAAASDVGEGIGLSIVRQLCEMLGASLDLESAPGRGSTFSVSFPARYAGAAAQPE